MSTAYCGLRCDRCPVYIATIQKDAGAMARLASEYSTPDQSFTASDMSCMGCRSDGAKTSKMCGGCEIRICAGEHGLGKDTCAACGEYPCALIEKYVPMGTEARTELELRRG